MLVGAGLTKLGSIASGVLLAFSVMVQPGLGAEMPQVGQNAPEFTLPSQDGSPVNIKDFYGKWVVLYFYPKDNTTGCTIEAHNFQTTLPNMNRTML